MKRCICCGRTLALAEFYLHKQMADGHLNKCKECCKRHANERRWANLEEARERDRQRGKNPKRRAAHVASATKYSKANPTKSRVRYKVYKAIKAGKLVRKPCEVCGALNTHAHHHDYSKPLDVKWLCPACHAKVHHPAAARQ